MPEIRKASCLMCSLQCGFNVEVDRGVPVRVDFEKESPLARGSLCARGHYNLEILLHPKRFLAATVNRRRVPWSAAVTKVAGRIDEIKKNHGADALGIIVGTELSNEDYEAAVGFATHVLGTTNIGVAYDGNDYGVLTGGGTGDATPEDLDEADCFVLIGDVFWGHPTVSKRIIDARHKSRSNQIITINPYRSNTDWFADLHIEPPAGSEPLILAGLLKAMNVQGSPSVDIDRAAAAGGMSKVGLERLATRLRDFRKVVVIVSSRLGDSTSGYMTGLLAAKLASAAGGKYAPLFRGGNAIGAFQCVSSDCTTAEILAGVADKRIKGLLVFGPDPVQLYPGAVSLDDLESLDFLAASAIFENDTTKHSEVGLPQVVWTEFDGSYSPSFNFATSVEACVKAQGDARSVGAMLVDIASEMGTTIPVGGLTATHPELGVDVDAALAKMASKPPDGLELVESISPLHRWDGTLTGRMSFPQMQKPYCEVWLSEEAAGEAGIEQGSTMVISTARGETRMITTVTDRMPPGLVAIPTYVPDARGLMVWTVNPKTKWFDVTSSNVKVAPEG
jgi:anaerobic selenocysteine-containing dehydrogenase